MAVTTPRETAPCSASKSFVFSISDLLSGRKKWATGAGGFAGARLRTRSNDRDAPAAGAPSPERTGREWLGGYRRLAVVGPGAVQGPGCRPSVILGEPVSALGVENPGEFAALHDVHELPIKALCPLSMGRASRFHGHDQSINRDICQ